MSVEKLLDYIMERCERKAEVQVFCLDNCYYISSGDVEFLRSKGLKKLLLMLSGME